MKVYCRHKSPPVVSIQFLFCRSRLHTVFQNTFYCCPYIYTELFQGLCRRKTAEIRIRKRRKMLDIKTTKMERNKAMKETKKLRRQ
jgi:hypothetical protein